MSDKIYLEYDTVCDMNMENESSMVLFSDYSLLQRATNIHIGHLKAVRTLHFGTNYMKAIGCHPSTVARWKTIFYWDKIKERAQRREGCFNPQTGQCCHLAERASAQSSCLCS